jgi:hypothetical protein
VTPAIEQIQAAVRAIEEFSNLVTNNLEAHTIELNTLYWDIVLGAITPQIRYLREQLNEKKNPPTQGNQ